MDMPEAIEPAGARIDLPLTDALLRLLEGSIANGDLQLGDRLAEQTLADRLGVSRGPIRESIRALEARRILERTPNAGVRVRNLSIDDLEQLLITREALEGMCSRLAAENMTLKDVQGLRACVGEDEERLMREGVGATFRPGAEDNDFHARIALGSRNLWLAQYLTRDVYALLRLYRLKQISLDNRATESRNEHLEIIEAIQQRQADAAETLMRAHVRRGRERLLEALAGQG